MPYPAFIQSDELPDVYIAGLPGVNAKQYAGDPRTRRSSNRLELPANWQFSTGASPGKSVEMFILAGAVELGEFSLGPGGYAYLPAGSTGMNMRTDAGAVLLYFLDDSDPAAVIQTPFIVDSSALRWQPKGEGVASFGLSIKELRADPGSGARTHLLRVEAGASLPWSRNTVPEEGYLVSGTYQHSECVNGAAATAVYMPGGYFKRPAGAVNGGTEAGSLEPSVWFLRMLSAGRIETVGTCGGGSAVSP